MTHLRLAIALIAVMAVLALPAAAHMGTAGHTHPHGGGLTIAPGVTILLSERLVDVSTAYMTDTRIHEKVLLETPAAVANFSEIQMTYNSVAATVRVLMVRRLRPDGKGHYIATSLPARGDTAVEERYEDALIDTMHVRFPGCQPGDIIEYELVKSDAPMMPQRFYTTLFWQTEYKTAASRLVVMVPKGMPVASKCWGVTITPTVTEVRNRTRYEWSQTAAMPAYSPASQPIQPCVVAGTPTTWQEVNDWYRGLFRPVLDASPTVRAKAQELVGTMQDTPDKLKAIADFVCNKLTTDTNEVGTSAWRAAPGDLVLAKGAGDCKAKVALMCAMLKCVGIIGQPALTYTATACPPLADQLPSPFAFNHVILAVSGPGNAIWIDPTQMAAKEQFAGFKREVMLLGDRPSFMSVEQFSIY